MRWPVSPAFHPAFFFLCLVSTTRAHAADPGADLFLLRTQITQHVTQSHFQGALWGIKIVSLDTGATLFEHNPSHYFSPASNTKLFTTAAALDRLGPDYQIVTSLYAKQPPNRRGTLKGDLVIYGRGDPSFKTEATNAPQAAVARIVAALRQAGVRKIRGDIIADESFFRGPPFGSGWALDDLQYSYGAEVSSLTVNDNLVRMKVRAGRIPGERCAIETIPSLALLCIHNRASTRESGEKSTLFFERLPVSNELYLLGSLPVHQIHEEEIPIHNPAAYFGELCRQALREGGISVSGKVRTRNWLSQSGPPVEAVELGRVCSVPLSEIVRRIQKPSQNLYTDLLLAHLGSLRLETNRLSIRETSEEAGLRELRDFLKKAGLRAADVVLEEGSGLSRNNLVTPQAIVVLLRYMDQHRDAAVYRAALPVAGVDGTLRRRMTNTVASGNVQAKTGSLRWANSLSGYVTTASGERLAFSIMLNRFHHPDMTARSQIDLIPVWLASFRGRTGTKQRSVDIQNPDKKYFGRQSQPELNSVMATRAADKLEESNFPNIRREVAKIVSSETGPIRDRCAARELDDDPRWAIVRVSVANLRFLPWHQAELGTQLLMGTVVKVLREHDSWWYVQSPDQYLGWVENAALLVGDSALAQRWLSGERLILTELHERILEKPDKLSFPVTDAVGGCLVHDAGHTEGWMRVRLPDDRIGYLKQNQALNFDRWKKSVKASPENLERVAKSLMGVPYLWGGTSTKALDCSGFTKTVYLLNGIQLNRDAMHQALQGEEVAAGAAFENLRKGDLLFFTAKPGAKRTEPITHVAMYLDQKMYVHSSGMVHVSSLDPDSPLFDAERRKTFVQARRILVPPPQG